MGKWQANKLVSRLSNFRKLFKVKYDQNWNRKLKRISRFLMDNFYLKLLGQGCVQGKSQYQNLSPTSLFCYFVHFYWISSFSTFSYVWEKFKRDCYHHKVTYCACSLTLVAAAAAKSLQSCPTLCDPIYGRPPGSPVPGILQARTLKWVAISFSSAWKWKVKVQSLSRVRLFATPWTGAYHAPPSMDFPGKSIEVGCHCLVRIV